MRVFVAIDLPDAARAALEEVQDDLPTGRLLAPETFHLTLSFLDEQPQHVIAAVDEELATIRFTPFPLVLRGVDVFGGKRPKVLWVGVGAQPELGALREKIRRAVARAGLELPRERFRPHVTLAGFRGEMRGGELARLAGFLGHHAGFAASPFQVDGFRLFRSTLSPDGAVHETLALYQAPSRA